MSLYEFTKKITNISEEIIQRINNQLKLVIDKDIVDKYQNENNYTKITKYFISDQVSTLAIFEGNIKDLENQDKEEDNQSVVQVIDKNIPDSNVYVVNSHSQSMTIIIILFINMHS